MLFGVQVADSLRLKNVRLQQLVQEEDYQAVYTCVWDHLQMLHNHYDHASSASQTVPQPYTLLAGSSAAR